MPSSQSNSRVFSKYPWMSSKSQVKLKKTWHSLRINTTIIRKDHVGGVMNESKVVFFT